MAADLDHDWYWVTDGSQSTVHSLLALDKTGKEVHRVTWEPAFHDVQAMSWANGALYVADIGDKDAKRRGVRVMSPTSPAADQSTYHEWMFTYPDGAHDAKALAVSPKGSFYIITGGPAPAIYRGGPQASRTESNPLEKVANAPAGVKDATFLPDGSRLAMLTDHEVRVVDAYSWKTLANASFSGGQAITTDTTQKTLEIATSGTAVKGLDFPTTLTSVSPTPSSTPTPRAGATQASGKPTSKARSGTLTAVLGAFAVALCAGVVTFFHGRSQDTTWRHR
ncbi:hypothetical protein O6R08_02105 [Cutibacterium equinum]|uniref:Uncharacterized protein n=1 Tax=Cutibacterium equinum TaxID=3016342 RepID=A0ABY7R206_9ACTN|nr:hypothetical protein [Cutibacterium equinum]WCC80990.1 hypothetical protein O6R08_02105 [Cutibacterium equinum]